MAHSKGKAFEVQCNEFLSSGGVDTCYDFTSDLHRRLENPKICVFGDKEKIEVGDNISEKILQAIDNSQICVPIISQTCPLDNKWSLVKLAHMMKNVSQSEGRKRIFPIFYRVEPKDVKDRISHLENPFSEAELSLFKDALANVGRIKGWEVMRQSDKEIIDSVAQKVLEELDKERGSQTSCPIEPSDLTESLKDLLDCAMKRCIGRGRSLSKSTTEIDSMQHVRMELGSIGRGEMKEITSMTAVQRLRMECSEERED